MCRAGEGEHAGAAVVAGGDARAAGVGGDGLCGPVQEVGDRDGQRLEVGVIHVGEGGIGVGDGHRSAVLGAAGGKIAAAWPELLSASRSRVGAWLRPLRETSPAPSTGCALKTTPVAVRTPPLPVEVSIVSSTVR